MASRNLNLARDNWMRSVTVIPLPFLDFTGGSVRVIFSIVSAISSCFHLGENEIFQPLCFPLQVAHPGIQGGEMSLDLNEIVLGSGH